MIGIVDLNELSQLHPEEIGWLILSHIQENPTQQYRGNRRVDSPNFQFSRACEICSDNSREVSELIVEGWMWLESHGLIAPDPQQHSSEIKILTRRGREISSEKAMMDFRASKLIPEEIIHPQILTCSKAAFLRKDYDSAVFTAFRQVEINVRQAAAQPDEVVGERLMRDAFNINNGALTDFTLVEAERLNMQHLFASSIGSFKNPGSHREISFQSDEAAELLMLASRLIKIVDKRVTANQPEEP